VSSNAKANILRSLNVMEKKRKNKNFDFWILVGTSIGGVGR